MSVLIRMQKMQFDQVLLSAYVNMAGINNVNPIVGIASALV